MTTAQLDALHGAIQTSISSGAPYRHDILTGYSGSRLMGCLQRFSEQLLSADTCYVEIGVFQGLTLLSVAKHVGSGRACYGIDNFAFFDAEGNNQRIIEECRAALAIDNAHLINHDYEDAMEQLERHIGDKKIGVFFVDGPHDYRSQLMCLLLAKPYLADDCVILVDDSNYRHVRQANRDFLVSHPEYKLLYEAYTPGHPSNLKGTDLEDARNGWWNGINIIVRDTQGILPADYPATIRDRSLYENEHTIHAAKYPEETINMVRFLQAFYKKKPLQLLQLNLKHLLSGRRDKQSMVGRYDSMNTYSAELTKGRSNPYFD